MPPTRGSSDPMRNAGPQESHSRKLTTDFIHCIADSGQRQIGRVAGPFSVSQQVKRGRGRSGVFGAQTPVHSHAGVLEDSLPPSFRIAITEPSQEELHASDESTMSAGYRSSSVAASSSASSSSASASCVSVTEKRFLMMSAWCLA